MTELLLWSFYPFTRYNGVSYALSSPAYGFKSLAVYIQINSAGIADCYNNLLIAVPHHTVTRLQKRFFCLFVINPGAYPCQLTRIDFQHNRFNLLLYNLIILCNHLRLNLASFSHVILVLGINCLRLCL